MIARIFRSILDHKSEPIDLTMGRILLLVMAWFLSGALATWSLGFSWLAAIQVGLFSLIIALTYLAVLILPIEHNRRLFFSGPEMEDEFYLHVGCLWFIPLITMVWLPLILAIKFLF